MDVSQHSGQLSIGENHMLFGGKIDPGNCWVLLHKVIPWMSLESHDAPQFSAKTGALVKPFQLAFGAVYIQRRLGMTDRETVGLITESPYLQFLIGLSGYQALPPAERPRTGTSPAPEPLRQQVPEGEEKRNTSPCFGEGARRPYLSGQGFWASDAAPPPPNGGNLIPRTREGEIPHAGESEIP